MVTCPDDKNIELAQDGVVVSSPEESTVVVGPVPIPQTLAALLPAPGYCVGWLRETPTEAPN